ncbi:hypothetical protein FKG94_09030 [Exilibacterium tricleocarpae]|uniref:Uncharacterized protein n=1 Tax=Exilibacterium tricleocarpae TaxID=2591008 RepID=A0A545TVJ1_9GAMM|nr:hypothetical protein [Exilibacterium tricleocarpae]TQV81235.1 hypothetical protein FKG94_09030 [Exilibacterium tricleocarpae]
MTFKNLFIEHRRTPEAQAWIDEEVAAQEQRFQTIEKQMRDLAPQREIWYREFFDRISTIGFNADGDDKVRIKPEDLPVQPEGRRDRVVWKHGTDTD